MPGPTPRPRAPRTKTAPKVVPPPSEVVEAFAETPEPVQVAAPVAVAAPTPVVAGGEPAKKPTARKPRPQKRAAKQVVVEQAESTQPEEAGSETVDGAEGAEDVEKPKVKKPKTHKPPPAFELGINLSVSKIKSIGFDSTINQDNYPIIKELKKNKILVPVPENATEEEKLVKKYTFDASKLSDETVAVLKELYEQQVETHSAKFAKKRLTEIRKRGDEEKKQVSEFIKAHKHVFPEADEYVAAFGADFWEGFEPFKSFDDFFVGEDLDVYNGLNVLASQGKIKFNSNLKVQVTAFTEFLIRDLIHAYILSSLKNQKRVLYIHKIAQQDTLSKDGGNRWFNVFLQMPVFKEILGQLEESVESEVKLRQLKNPSEVESVDDWYKIATSDQVFQELKTYLDNDLGGQYKDLLSGVSNISKELRYELAETTDPEQFKSHPTYANLNMNKAFRHLVSTVGYDIIVLICNLLNSLARARKIKTINNGMFDEMVRVMAINYSVQPEDFHAAIQFVSERTTRFKESQLRKKEENKKKKAAKLAEEALVTEGGVAPPEVPAPEAAPVAAPVAAA